jgi:hypothetical protein
MSGKFGDLRGISREYAGDAVFDIAERFNALAGVGATGWRTAQIHYFVDQTGAITLIDEVKVVVNP